MSTPTSTGSGYVFAAPIRYGDPHDALAPLIQQLHAYDSMRRRLETEGGHVGDLTTVAKTLGEPLRIAGNYHTCEASLTDQAALQAAVRGVGWDIKLAVRQLDSRMPAYYLCRVHRDYWSEYSLIVEDYYRSPGYPMLDERFVPLMHMGHETYHLRLSQFRRHVAAMTGDGRRTDEVLYNLGRQVFQAAWHDDQRVGMLTAKHFGLTHFADAIELLYLCLSGDLCELRSAVDEPMRLFFDVVYSQPAIGAFLKRLAVLDGGVLNEIPQQALRQYAELLRAFGAFIQIEVPWGARSLRPPLGRRCLRVPLYRLIFGNMSRLGRVAKALGDVDEVRRAAAALEATAQRIIDQILAMDAPHPARA
ncbi:hypothetical protein HQ576_16775 [bacterium]|nr:hypothetical protein [bacterium]